METNPTTEESGKKTGIEYINDVAIPLKISSLRQKLGQKAKQEPKFRFYTLYDHILKDEVIRTSWKLVLKNGGSGGVDGVTIKELLDEPLKLEKLITSTINELKEGRYVPKPVMRVYIPKANGKMRPLGIPTIKDRIVQMAVKLIIEPIFEADFLECSYGFRPDKSAHQALENIRENLKDGYTIVYDADLQGYFDSIPQDKLMKCIRMRITDGRILKLIRMWLKTQIVERGEDGKKNTPKRSDKGTPQGGVISPLLANIYLHWFDVKFHRADGLSRTINAKLVRYADDFVVMMSRYTGKAAIWIENKIEGWLGLLINRDKTKIVDMNTKGESLNFLGYSFRFDRCKYNSKRQYLNVFPSKKTIEKEKAKIAEMTGGANLYKPINRLIKDINAHLKGWRNYFKFGYPSKAFRNLNWYVETEIIGNLERRSQRRYQKKKEMSYYEHLLNLGVYVLRP